MTKPLPTTRTTLQTGCKHTRNNHRQDRQMPPNAVCIDQQHGQVASFTSHGSLAGEVIRVTVITWWISQQNYGMIMVLFVSFYFVPNSSAKINTWRSWSSKGEKSLAKVMWSETSLQSPVTRSLILGSVLRVGAWGLVTKIQQCLQKSLGGVVSIP